LQLTTDEVDQALESAVQARLVADRPLGCFLSGGVDSSLISLYAKRHMPEIQTFCLRMPDQRFDESRIAASVASQIGARHTTLEVSTDVAADLVRIIEEIGAPFGDSSLLPTMWLCREAKKHVTVALAGDGGDELFAGYERHLAAPALDYWWWLFRLLPRSLIEGSGAKSPLSKLNRLCVASDDILFQRQACMLLRRLWSNPQLKRLFVPNGDGRPGYAMGTGIYPERATRRFLWQRLMRAWKDPHAAWTASVSDALDHDIDDYLPNDILFKTDSASMHSALEVRAPFLDSKVAALARSATIDSLMPNGQRKGLLRALARKYLPASIVDRPKMGFAIPLADWFRSDFGSLRTLLGDLVINAKDPFPADILGCELNRTFIRELFDQHMSGKRDHAQRLYALLVMAIWCRWYRRITRGEAARPAQPSRP
jgi:asparagine synthase (glutamine-hydrolysing)